MINVDQMW